MPIYDILLDEFGDRGGVVISDSLTFYPARDIFSS
jgi:hypothetical protein